MRVLFPGCLALLVACRPPEEAAAPASVRLRAEGTRIVDGAGATVELRGVALGGWLFHENWITDVDYPAHGRLHVLGAERGIGDEVDAALRAVGPNEKGDAEWLDALSAALAPTVGADATDALLADFAQYPPIVDDSDLPLRTVLEQRFGVDGRDALLDAFQGAWLQQGDIDWIAAQGFNVVRVPMGWRDLTSQSDLEAPTSLVWNEAAFARLDALLGWCDDAGIYAVLDIQEAPGGQNEYAAPSTLYTDPAMQALTVELWSELSRRYRDNDRVAAYSLLAEPMSAPSAEARDEEYDQLVRAIRANGDDHLLVIHDGFRGMQTMPDPAAYGWENVVYSTHLFEWSAASLEDYESFVAMYEALFTNTQADQGVPYYIGSFATFQDEDWAYQGATALVDLFERSGWAWTLWTYKRIDDPIDTELYGTQTAWGVRGRLATPFERPDLYRDDEATLQAKMAGYADVIVDENSALSEALWAGVP